MQTAKKWLSMLLALVLVLGLLPTTAFAAQEMVYISVSYDDKYIQAADGSYLAYVGIPLADIAAVDLTEYGLDEYLYDKNGDGTYETAALQLIIYAHENLYGGNWDDIDFTGAPGSSYFQGGIFGFDENLNYFLNGIYPMDEEMTEAAGYGVGATSDRIVLKAGDVIEMGSFSSWDFYQDTGYGFHEFADENGEFVHTYTVAEDTALPIKLVRSYSGMGSGAEVYDEPGYTVYYGSTYGNAISNVTTDDAGCASVTFAEPGTYYLWCDGGYGNEYPEAIVNTPAYAIVTVTVAQTEEPTDPPADPSVPGTAQDVSTVLNATMAQMAAKVTAPAFGTNAGEWTVLSLARGGYYAKDNTYFTDYYNRIVETVNTTAAKVNMSGALHKSKSTDNSRLIVALSAIGKDATSVGDWDLVEAYSANGFSWIKKQGLNGTIWALIALDSNNYVTSDTTIRQQCVDAIVAAQHDDGGWSLMANKATASDPDVTGMALTALYPYRDQAAVAEACAEAFECMSAMQSTDEKPLGHFFSGGAPNAESASWVIVSCCTWGINPDTDPRFIKNGVSAVDAVLAHYVEAEAEFKHIIAQTETNAMATDQSCYALVAYDRLLKGKSGLYDFSDVTFDASSSGESGNPGSGNTGETDPNQMNATLALPQKVENTVGTTFNATITIDKWDNEAGYKLVDFLMTIPEGLSVTGVTAGDRLFGGSVSYNLDDDGSLRCVYFDANENKTLTISGTEFPAEVFTIGFEIKEAITAESLKIAITGMSVKLNSDSSEDAGSMIVVNTKPVTDPEGGTTGGGSGDVGIVTGVSFSAVELYVGDNVDLIPDTRKAIAVAVTGIDSFSTLVYNDGTNNLQFQYSDQITSKTNIPTFVALVDAQIPTANFINKNYFTINGGADQNNIAFGDTNSDGQVNAQDALAVVDAWLRKGDAPSDNAILRMNVNGDSRINTFDALGIVEAFVNGSTYGVVTKAMTLASQP